MFYGIVIRMYFRDDKQHHVPYLHAEYAGKRFVFSLDNGEVLAGELPSGKAAWFRHGSKSTARNCRRIGSWQSMAKRCSRLSR
jgi:hypothetical protein